MGRNEGIKIQLWVIAFGETPYVRSFTAIEMADQDFIDFLTLLKYMFRLTKINEPGALASQLG